MSLLALHTPGSPAEGVEDEPGAGATLRPPACELLTAWVLLLLDDASCHGYELRGRLEAAGVMTDTGAVYRVLRKLERDGCAASSWETSEAGPRRRLYRLTARGRRALAANATRIAAARDDHAAFLDAHARARA
ncbi:MAG TPA: helix-turn-helix transcriptional regulator [Solirubrobacteraceae bacterium]|nr:helix-turn-helix transcriptional regulator [Solirubrobacteraceae bacterium]